MSRGRPADERPYRARLRPWQLRYVALGDSYTIGTGVRPAERWPDQLVAALGRRNRRSSWSPTSAVNGYTSEDLIRHELPFLEADGRVRERPDRGQRRRPGRAAGDLRGERGGDPRHAARAAGAGPGGRRSRFRTTRSRPRARDYGDPARQHAAIVAANDDHGALLGRARDRLGRHLRPVAAGGRRSPPRGGRRAPPEWSPVRPVGGADRAGRGERGSRADRPVRRFARSPERRPGNEAVRARDRAAAR